MIFLKYKQRKNSGKLFFKMVPNYGPVSIDKKGGFKTTLKFPLQVFYQRDLMNVFFWTILRPKGKVENFRPEVSEKSKPKNKKTTEEQKNNLNDVHFLDDLQLYQNFFRFSTFFLIYIFYFIFYFFILFSFFLIFFKFYSLFIFFDFFKFWQLLPTKKKKTKKAAEEGAIPNPYDYITNFIILKYIFLSTTAFPTKKIQALKIKKKIFFF